jgi:hypothetical protein
MDHVHVEKMDNAHVENINNEKHAQGTDNAHLEALRSEPMSFRRKMSLIAMGFRE